MPPDRSFAQLLARTRSLLRTDAPADAGASPDRVDAPSDVALDEARRTHRARLAELFYELALAYFAEAERASERVLVLGTPRAAAGVRKDLDFASGVGRAISDDSEESERWLDRARGDDEGDLHRRSRSWCNAAVALSGAHHEGALELLGALLVLEGRDAAALVAFDHLAETTRSPEIRARTLSNRSKALLDLGCPRDAEAAAERAAALSPGHAYAHSNLATSRLLQGNVSGALRAWASLAEVCPPSQSGAHARIERLVRSDLRWASRRSGRTAHAARMAHDELKSMGLFCRSMATPTSASRTSTSR